MKATRKNLPFFVVLILFMTLSNPWRVLSQSPFWTGDGGSGIRITVFPPRGIGLSEQKLSLLPLIQSTIIGIWVMSPNR